MTPRRFIAPSAVLWLLLGAAYFLIPLIATLIFSLRSNQTGTCCTLENYGTIIHDPQFLKTIKTSFILSLETIFLTLVLLVPTVYWVHLKLPRLRSVIGFMALVPFVIPPIILVVGLLDVYKGTPTWFYAEPYGFLVAAYVILAFPYMYFSLDTGFRSIDVHTLTEASRNLGASWRTTWTCMTYFTKSCAMPFINDPNISKPSRCHSTSGSFWPMARRLMPPWR